MKNQWNLILSSFFCLAIVLVISSTAGNKQSLPTEPEEGKWLPITENDKRHPNRCGRHPLADPLG